MTLNIREEETVKLSEDKIWQFQGRMMAAKNPEDVVSVAKEMGYEMPEEDAAGFLATVKGEEDDGSIPDEMLSSVNGGIEIGDVPQYDVIKDYCKEKGANLAFILCIYFIPSPSCYDIVQIIEQEIGAEEELTQTTDLNLLK